MCSIYYRKGEGTQGVLAIHVDDILFGGAEEFLSEVMQPLRGKRQVSVQTLEGWRRRVLGKAACAGEQR